MSDLVNILPKVSGSYRYNSLIKNWFDTKTTAEVIFKPKDQDDIINFLKNFHKKDLIKIIGATSNIVFQNELVKGVIIKLPASFAGLEIVEDDILNVGGANLCKNVTNFLLENSLSNLEFLTGIPGSIGGAVAMNAGCYGSKIKDFLISATAIDLNGNLHQFSNQDFGFFYRGSNLVRERGQELIFISAKFKCAKNCQSEIAKKIAEFNQKREESQPIRAKTGGSTFKNPANSDKKAWQLIDEAGCRGLKVGDAQISTKHCNFLINTGNATGQDIVDLIKMVQDRVKLTSKIKLETELKIFNLPPN